MGNIQFIHHAKEKQVEKSDVGLVYSCGMGELEALGLLFERYHKLVYRFLARMSGTDYQDLDDLVQKTFLEISRSAHRFKRKSSVKSWILAIASNVARNHIRSEIRRKNFLKIYNEAPAPSPHTPQDSFEHDQMMDRLSDAIEGLSHKLRVVFVMCDLEGISGVETARVLGLREGTVWRRLHEARKQLCDAIEQGNK